MSVSLPDKNHRELPHSGGTVHGVGACNAGAVNGPTSYVGFRCVVRGRVGDES
jgi:hypothetical protein